MRKKKVEKRIAQSVASVLSKVLIVEANSASCIVTYQSKTPKELSKFRKIK